MLTNDTSGFCETRFGLTAAQYVFWNLIYRYSLQSGIGCHLAGRRVNSTQDEKQRWLMGPASSLTVFQIVAHFLALFVAVLVFASNVTDVECYSLLSVDLA